VKGFEADMRARIFEGFQVQIGLSLIDATYKNFPHASVTVPCSSLGIPAPINCVPGDPTGPAAGFPPPDLSGKSMPYAPKFSGNVALNYRLPVSFGAFEFAVLANHSGKYYFEPVNRLTQDAYTVVNASITLHSKDEHWFARAWGNNVTDEKYLTYLAPVQFGDFGHYADPRTYGVTLGYGFK
jgi:iron complex outermembrane receptor protein